MDPSDLELVRGVRATPALFDNTNSDFKFAYRKEKIWVELSQYLGINMNDARRRWTCLRDRYTRELKNRRLNPNLPYSSQDEFYKEMDFLRPYVRKRKERSSIVCKIDSKTAWEGKLEKHDYSTCDSSYSNNCKMESDKNNTTEEVNVDEMFQNYDVDKDDTVSIVMDSNNDITEECDEAEEEDEPLINQENYGYQVQMIAADGDSTTHATIQNCKIIAENPVEVSSPSPQCSKQISTPKANDQSTETEDDFFCKSLCVYLRQLNRVHKIKAKVEMFKILQKYIEIEEGVNV